MTTYFVLFLFATFASLVLTPIVRRLCERFKLLDIPLDGRRLHSRAIPRLGGVAIYLSCILALATLPIIDNLLTKSLRGHVPEVFVVLIPVTLVLLLGAYDDLRGTNATVKFVVLGLIATLFYALGGRIEAISAPFMGSIHLPGPLSFVITILWLVGIANAFNLIDGLDGLASGAALFSSLVILAVSISQGRSLTIVVALVLCGSLAGFLRYNFNPASIFLGDSGALFVGFTLAALSVLGTQKATTAVAVVIPILAFGFPMVDMTVTVGRRLISRQPVFQGDNEHVHHMLLARGWSQRQVALVLYGVCASFGLVAMVFTTTGSNVTGFVMFVISVTIIIALGHNNIRVRRAARALSKSVDLHEVFEAVRAMLEFGEFSFADAQVGQAGRAEVNELAFKASAQRHSKQQLKLHNGRVSWTWAQDASASEDQLRPLMSWCLRLPLVKDGVECGWLNLYRKFSSEALLVDMNYLSDLFRRELTDATERIFNFHEASIATEKVRMNVATEKIHG